MRSTEGRGSGQVLEDSWADSSHVSNPMVSSKYPIMLRPEE